MRFKQRGVQMFANFPVIRMDHHPTDQHVEQSRLIEKFRDRMRDRRIGPIGQAVGFDERKQPLSNRRDRMDRPAQHRLDHDRRFHISGGQIDKVRPFGTRLGGCPTKNIEISRPELPAIPDATRPNANDSSKLNVSILRPPCNRYTYHEQAEKVRQMVIICRFGRLPST